MRTSFKIVVPSVLLITSNRSGPMPTSTNGSRFQHWQSRSLSSDGVIFSKSSPRASGTTPANSSAAGEMSTCSSPWASYCHGRCRRRSMTHQCMWSPSAQHRILQKSDLSKSIFTFSASPCCTPSCRHMFCSHVVSGTNSRGTAWKWKWSGADAPEQAPLKNTR